VRTARELRRGAADAAASGAVSARSSRLRRAAHMFGHLPRVPLLIEHQLTGANYRLLYLDGVLIDALRRDSPSVTGDGRLSIDALIDNLNDDRLDIAAHTALPLVTRDLELHRTLAAQGLTVDSIPPAGVPVRLKTVVNQNSLRDNWPTRDELCESVIEDGARAAAVLGARFVGVDVITTDPGVPLRESGGCILEINVPPGMAIHYHGHPGMAEPATLLLQHLSETREPEHTL
ncbi:MAG: hypothetical protein ACRDRL_25760, partial [Sciscionella sp.]